MLLPSRRVFIYEEPQQVAQLSQRDCAAWWVNYGQNVRLELGDNILLVLIELYR